MKEFKILDFAGIDFPFYIDKGTHTESFIPHTHNFIELEIIIDGSADHIVEGKTYKIKKGDVLIIRPYFMHEIQNVQNLEAYNLKFNLDKLILLDTDIEKSSGFQALFIAQSFDKYQRDYKSHMNLDEIQLSHVKMLCELINTECLDRQEGYTWVVKSYFLSLITYLSRSFSLNCVNNCTKANNIIKTVIFTYENLSNKITLSMLAKIACLSERQYTRIFKELYGVSPIEYVINCRLTLACRIMKNTDKSLIEISTICGFSDNIYFSRLFKKRYNITPGQYRKQLK